MSNDSSVKVYVVQTLSGTTENVELLGIFDTEARARVYRASTDGAERVLAHHAVAAQPLRGRRIRAHGV